MFDYALKKIRLLFSWALPASSNDEVAKEIQANLHATAAAWNRGDHEALMRVSYLNSESTVYISADPSVPGPPTLIRGYKKIAIYLKTNYPTEKEMGKITFSKPQVTLLSPKHCVVCGKWVVLDEKNKKFKGVFSSVFVKTSKGWKSLLEHTSSA